VSSQFDVFANPVAAARGAYPFLVLLQSDLVEQMKTRVVAPASLAVRTGAKTNRLLPLVAIEQERYLVLVPRVFAIDRSELRTAIGNVRDARAELIQAIDLLFVGV